MTIDEALKHFESKSALAKALGITRQAVSYWGETIPEGKALRLKYEIIPNLTPSAQTEPTFAPE